MMGEMPKLLRCWPWVQLLVSGSAQPPTPTLNPSPKGSPAAQLLAGPHDLQHLAELQLADRFEGHAGGGARLDCHRRIGGDGKGGAAALGACGRGGRAVQRRGGCMACGPRNCSARKKQQQWGR